MENDSCKSAAKFSFEPSRASKNVFQCDSRRVIQSSNLAQKILRHCRHCTIGASNFRWLRKTVYLLIWCVFMWTKIRELIGFWNKLEEPIWYCTIKIWKKEDLRNSLVLIGVTPLWHVAKWVSRAPPHRTLPTFLNLNVTECIFNFKFLRRSPYTSEGKYIWRYRPGHNHGKSWDRWAKYCRCNFSLSMWTKH